MPDQRDRTLIEEARTQRMRLGAALLYGRVGERRTINDNMRRFVGSLVVAALACAACTGVSFVVDLLATQAAEKQSESTQMDVVPAPRPSTPAGAGTEEDQP